MHPDNVGCLRAARLDICILANNHVLDYGPAGLIETLETLRKADIRAVGAGRNRDEAMSPVVHAVPGGQHLIVGACAHESSGVPDHWAALTGEPGVNLLPDLSDETAADEAARVVEGGIDIVYGHSSHHVRPIEIYRDRLILYGCGDFIDDCEGITGYERCRDDLVLMFFPSVSPQTGRLLMLEMTPLQFDTCASIAPRRPMGDGSVTQ